MKLPVRALAASSRLSAAAIMACLIAPGSTRAIRLPDVTRRELDDPEADLYLPPGGPWPGMVLVLGALREGRRYPLLERTARAIAGCGFAVMVPELGRLRRLVLGEEALEDLVAATLALAGCEGVRHGPVSLVGFSLGGSLAMLAAADGRLREEVACVGNVGGYFGLVDMLRWATTGAPAAPSAFAVAASLVDPLPEPDRALLEAALEARPDEPLQAIAAVDPDLLGPQARTVVAVLRNREPDAVEGLAEGLDGFRRFELALSPEHAVDRIEAPVWVLHDERDAYVPADQTRRLQAAVRGRRNFRFFSVRVFEHTEPRPPGFDLRRLSRDYLPGLVSLFSFASGVVGAARDEEPEGKQPRQA